MTIVDNIQDTQVVEQNNKSGIIIYDNIDRLVIGGTCTFAFNFDGFSVADIIEAEVIYKESLSIKYTKKYSLDEIVIIEPNPLQLFVYSTLTAEETSLFTGNRRVDIQVKFNLINGSTLYGEKATLAVISPLDK